MESQVIINPSDACNKPHSEAVALLSCWFMSISDAVLAYGVDPTFIVEALNDTRREIDNDIAQLDAAEMDHS